MRAPTSATTRGRTRMRSIRSSSARQQLYWCRSPSGFEEHDLGGDVCPPARAYETGAAPGKQKDMSVHRPLVAQKSAFSRTFSSIPQDPYLVHDQVHMGCGS